MSTSTGEGGGLRERKKRRTRRLLIEIGLRLFAEKGYEATTVADICAAAEVAPATFYAYFPAKEDLVFADQPARVEAMRQTITTREPEESLRSALLRGVHLLTSSPQWSIAPDEELVAVRARLIFTVPSLLAVALRWISDLQAEWADALLGAFPDELDELTAHAIIGSLVGAVTGTAMAHVRRGDPLEQLPGVAARAAEVALDGLPDSNLCERDSR